MLSLFPHIWLIVCSGRLYYARPLLALCLMLLDPCSYAAAQVDEEEPVDQLPIYQHTIWMALRLANHLGYASKSVHFNDHDLESLVRSTVLVMRGALHDSTWDGDGLGEVVDVVAFAQKTAGDSALRQTFLLELASNALSVKSAKKTPKAKQIQRGKSKVGRV